MKTTKSKKTLKAPTKNPQKDHSKTKPQLNVDMGPVWFYGRKKLAMAFELGLNFMITANNMGIELDRNDVVIAENILFKEFRRMSPNKIAGHYQMILLAMMGSLEKKK